MRAFLAIELPEDIRDALYNVASELRSRLKARASWVHRENLHVTLRFLGDVTGETAEKICAQLDPEAARLTARPLCIAGLGVFPNTRRARVLWCGARGDLADLVGFHAQCERAVRLCGIAPDERPWSPHVTLARFREPPSQHALENILNSNADFAAGEFPLSGVTLFSSELTPRGAVYNPIRKLAFSCPST